MVTFEVAFAIMAAVVDGGSFRGSFRYGKEELLIEGWDLIRSMKLIKHSDDENHEGESIWEHSKLVYEQLGISVDDPNLVNRTAAWAAVLHDVGKVWVAEYVREEDRMRFYGHSKISAEIAKIFMERIERVPTNMAPFPLSERTDEPLRGCMLMDMVRWHDAIISLQNEEKPDFRKMYGIFRNPAVRRVFLRLVRADCQPRAAGKRAKWADDFEADFEAYVERVEAQEDEKRLRMIRELDRFRKNRDQLLAFVRKEVGPEAARIVEEAETPQDIGKMYGLMSAEGKSRLIKKVKAFYEEERSGS